MQNSFTAGYSLKDFLEIKAARSMFSDEGKAVGITEAGFV